jgi:uncharacterized protein
MSSQRSNRIVLSAGIFYLVLFLIVFAVDAGFGPILKFPKPGPEFLKKLGVDLLWGAAAGIILVIASRIALKLWPVFRDVTETLRETIGPLTWSEAFLIAILSAIGEEFLFRGLIQHYAGIVVTSILFGLLHTGREKRFFAWTLFAALVGYVFGVLYVKTQDILCPVTAHFVVNFLNLKSERT